jgi:hypothetical protein
MNKTIPVAVLALAVMACLVTTPSPIPPPFGRPTPPHPPTPSPSGVPPTAAIPAGDPLPAFAVDLSQPFAEVTTSGEPLALNAWSADEPYAGEAVSLPINLSQVANAQVLAGLTDEQRAFLVENGFAAIHSQEAQFADIRLETAQRTGQPYYLTTDAAFHAVHLLFDELLKSLERQQLRPLMIAVTQAALDEVRASMPGAQGTAIEAETQQAVAYLSVALKLFDAEAEIDPAVAEVVAQQVAQIMAAGGRDRSALFPDFEDDYGAYKPVGHYSGDADLEAYFRGMTWFGRMHFRLADPENPDFVPSRVPLIVTLALRRAQLADGRPASGAWANVHQTLNFVIGPSDDAGPLEYAALMDVVYGNSVTYQGLADEGCWGEFLSRAGELPAPQINSLFVTSTVELAPEVGWRFMGQRFTLDGFIFQNLIFDKVQPQADGTRREFPSGLDVMAAFGSAPALESLDDTGATTFPNYSDQMDAMHEAVQDQPEGQWLGRFYDSWLYSFIPVLTTKAEAYPAYMQTAAWGYKDLNAALGSWAELKHDTILYSKMPEGAGGGGPPTSEPAPSYVEPNPLAFYRMAYMTRSLAGGMQARLIEYPPLDIVIESDIRLDYYLQGMDDLGDRLETLGDIAAKELAGEAPDDEESAVITRCLGLIECLNQDTGYNVPTSEMPKLPVIAAVSGAQNSVLEVGVGGIDRLYVVVPLEGQPQVAQGGVFSYYEFLQPRDQRLTDEEWRAMLADGSAPPLPAWAANFVLAGGQPAESLRFRVGDVYLITEAGADLNLRDNPSLQGAVILQLNAGEYVEIVGGPVEADGYTWWNVHYFDFAQEPSGWVVEDAEWFERSYSP